MKTKITPEWRWWRILLLIHLIVYEVFFISALANLNRIWYDSQNNFIILLGWTILLLIHVGTHYYYAGRANLSALERQAYREGFADAARQFSNQPDVIERLALDNDGELVEFLEKPKRDRL